MGSWTRWPARLALLLAVFLMGAVDGQAQELERIYNARRAILDEVAVGGPAGLSIWERRHKMLLKGVFRRFQQDRKARPGAGDLIDHLQGVIGDLGRRLTPVEVQEQAGSTEAAHRVLGLLHSWYADIAVGHLRPDAVPGVAVPRYDSLMGFLDRMRVAQTPGEAKLYFQVLEGLEGSGYLELQYGRGLKVLMAESGVDPDRPREACRVLGGFLEDEGEGSPGETFETLGMGQIERDPRHYAALMAKETIPRSPADFSVLAAMELEAEWDSFRARIQNGPKAQEASQIGLEMSREEGGEVLFGDAEYLEAPAELGQYQLDKENQALGAWPPVDGQVGSSGSPVPGQAPGGRDLHDPREWVASSTADDRPLGQGPPKRLELERLLSGVERQELGFGGGWAGGAAPESMPMQTPAADPVRPAAPSRSVRVKRPPVSGTEARDPGLHTPGGAPVGPRGPTIGDPENPPPSEKPKVLLEPVKPPEPTRVVEPTSRPDQPEKPVKVVTKVAPAAMGPPGWVWGLAGVALLVLGFGVWSVRQAQLARREVEELRRAVSQPGVAGGGKEDTVPFDPDALGKTRMSEPGGPDAELPHTRISEPGATKLSDGGPVGSDPGSVVEPRDTLSPGVPEVAAEAAVTGEKLPSWLSATLDTVLGDRYTERRVLGAGGMGTVVFAFDTRLERRVAIKVPPPHLASVEDFRKRFLREARALAKVEHPNIPRVHDIPVVPDGELPVMIMEFLDGQDLDARLDQQGVPEPKVALSWIFQAGKGLHAAHEKGVLHRDVKPANLMLCDASDGAKRVVKILDFGLAAMEQKEALTKSGILMGSLPYMPPEQLRGDRVGREADVYALAVTGFQLLTGELPFDPKDSYRVAVPDISRGGRQVLAPLDRVFRRGLAPSPADRYPTVMAFLQDLDRARNGTRPGAAGS